MAPRRRTRKPIPRTRRGWEAEVKGIGKLIAKLKTLELSEGQEWVDSMRKYYDDRLFDLTHHAPQAVREKAPTGRIRVDIIYE